MLKKIFFILFTLFFLIPNSFSKEDVKLKKQNWSFQGIFGRFDNSTLQRGLQVYQEVCSACHGMDGQAASGGNSPLIPNITAQNKEYIIAKLNDYKSGKINHPQMSLIAQMLTEDDIKNVSEWYSKIKISIELPTE